MGGCGLLEADAVAAHVHGCRNTMRELGMLEGGVEPAARPQHMVERFVWLRCREGGWWQPSVRVGEEVAAGGRLGAVLDPFGDELEVIAAPEAGVPLFITSSPAVTDDGLLLGLGAGITPCACINGVRPRLCTRGSGAKSTERKPHVSASQPGMTSASARSRSEPAPASTTHHDTTASVPGGDPPRAGST